MQILQRVVLGTAQLGMQYGFTTHLPSFQKSLSILDRSYELGIRQLDTAAVYGHSEKRIGKWLRLNPAKHSVKITTKLRKLLQFDTPSEVDYFVHKEFEQSRRRLNSDTIDGYITHEFSDILNPHVRLALREMQSQGQIKKFGASCYVPQEILNARARCLECNLFQIPANLLDRRLAEIGPKMQSLDCRFGQAHVMIRSIFARGILTTDEPLENKTKNLKRLISLIHEASRGYELSVPAFCLNYILSKYPDASVTFGVFEARQLDFLEEIILCKRFNTNIIESIEEQIFSSSFVPIDMRTI